MRRGYRATAPCHPDYLRRRSFLSSVRYPRLAILAGGRAPFRVARGRRRDPQARRDDRRGVCPSRDSPRVHRRPGDARSIVIHGGWLHSWPTWLDAYPRRSRRLTGTTRVHDTALTRVSRGVAQTSPLRSRCVVP